MAMLRKYLILFYGLYLGICLRSMGNAGQLFLSSQRSVFQNNQLTRGANHRHLEEMLF